MKDRDNMNEERSRRDFMDTYRKVRKQLPPAEKTIKPKNEFRRERFDWRKEIEDSEDYN